MLHASMLVCLVCELSWSTSLRVQKRSLEPQSLSSLKDTCLKEHKSAFFFLLCAIISDRFFLSQSAKGEGHMHKLLMWDIWQCSKCQSPSTAYLRYVSCTARGLYKSITCPLKANNVHADTQCSVARNHPVWSKTSLPWALSHP